MSMTQKWLAIYTRPRWEKKVDQLLKEKGTECYCPLNKIRRKWSDRVKLVEEPLFKSYVFVRINEDERASVRLTPGVMNFVYWDGKPAVIREREIANIKRFLDEHENVEIQKLKLKVDERIRVKSGPFMDKEGKILAVRHKTAKISIESLGFLLVAYIDKSKLVPLKS
jgi:transcription antitermination factor NusG